MGRTRKNYTQRGQPGSQRQMPHVLFDVDHNINSFVLYCFRDRVSLYITGFPRTGSVDQASFELTEI